MIKNHFFSLKEIVTFINGVRQFFTPIPLISDFYFLTSDFLGSFQTPHPPLKSTIINGCSLSKNMVKYIIIWYIQFEQILCSTYYLWILLSFLPAWTEIELKNLEKKIWNIFGRLSFFGEASGCGRLVGVENREASGCGRLVNWNWIKKKFRKFWGGYLFWGG